MFNVDKTSALVRKELSIPESRPSSSRVFRRTARLLPFLMLLLTSTLGSLAQSCGNIVTQKQDENCVGAAPPKQTNPLIPDHLHSLPELIDLAETNSPEGALHERKRRPVSNSLTRRVLNICLSSLLPF